MRHRSRLRDALEYGLAVLILNSLAYTPMSLSHRLARGYVRLLDLALPRLRRVAMRNLAMALPSVHKDEHVRIADGGFRTIARLLVSFSRFPRMNRSNIGHWIRYEGFEHVENAQLRGKGVLVATAHLGNWELSAFAHALLAAPMHVVVRPLDNRYIDALVTELRSLSGNRLIEKKDFARGILRALAANEAVGILIDQNSSLDAGVFVDFFGVPACTGTSFAKIAAHSGAAVSPGFALWSEEEQKFILHFYPPVEITGDAHADTARLQTVLEQVIREHPDQWLWMHRRWKTRPPGEVSLYESARVRSFSRQAV
jgi:Kdo2-lipid IVA lauroyltransferase/acyltransferase